MVGSALVTGASGGLGLAASAHLAGAGWHVLLGCRSDSGGRAVAAELRRRNPAASVEVLPLDLARLDSVRAAAEALRRAEDRPPLRAVVCNAAVQVIRGVQRSADGYELTFATNHLGHFLLVRLLLDQLTEPARIVFVTSVTHHGPPRSGGFPAPRWADPRVLADPDAPFLGGSPRAGLIRYATSKLANIYTAYELARRLAGRDITVTTFDPGVMPQTRLARDYPRWMRQAYERVAPLLVRLPLIRSVDSSGADLAWLVTAPELAGRTGVHFVGRRQRRSSKASYDRDRAAELWRASDDLTQDRRV